jgi:CheY-like chemotaxis protein
MKALVVDNDAFFVEFLADMLESRGVHVTKAYDGKEAIQKLEIEAFDLMFVDMIMPKIDGRQLLRYVHSKYPARGFPIVALSGVIAEQVGGLQDIGADYFIAKGPMKTMAKHIEQVIDRILHRSDLTGDKENIFLPDDLKPMPVTAELVQSVNFHRAILDNLGTGLIVIDKDTRIIFLNFQALDILDASYESTLNYQVISVFPDSERSRVIDALKQLLLHRDLKKSTQFIVVNRHKIRVIVSLLRIEDKIGGWIIAMEGTEQWVEQA